MRLIGFAGAMHSGKDTAYKVLSRYSVFESKCKATFRRAAFADPLKYAAMAAFGGTEKNYFGTPEEKSEIIHPWGVSARQIMQFLGTEMFRDTVSNLIPGIGSDFWVRRLEYELRGYDPNIIHCITDVRFQNEADWIVSENGIVIRILRSSTDIVGNGIQGHRSEAGFTLKERYYEVRNDGTREELLKNLLYPINLHFNLFN